MKNNFNCFRQNNNKQLLDRLKDLQIQLNVIIEKSTGITSYLTLVKVPRLIGPF